MIPACCRIVNGMARFRYFAWLTLLLGAVLLSACNLGSAQPTTDSGVGYIQTYAAQTVAVRLTQQVDVLPSPTATVAVTPVPPTPTTAVIENPTPVPPTATATVPVAGTQPISTCDQARFVRDITIPDGTTLNPGQSFQKTWQLRNSGTCTWSTGYAIVFAAGESFGAPVSAAIPKTVPPGETVNVTVAMVAPQEVGSYRGEWRLRNEQGQVFGLGDQAKPFWIEVNVAARTGTMVDFFLQASDAQWFTGVGSTANSALTFGGAIDNPAGAAVVMENAPLETGAPGEQVLMTIPRRETEGVISGIFAPYTVSSGDRFKASIGLLIPSGDCGEGNVNFSLGYREDGGGIVYLRDFNKSCSGQMLAVDVDLSALNGKTVSFVLTVRTNGAFSDDYAVWDKPRIER